MAANTAQEFLDRVRRSGLADDGSLERALTGRDPDQLSAAEAVDLLLAAGLLSAWQVEKLNEGRVKGYFLGKYKIIRALGAGAMGSVYLGEHRVMRHRVAIKVLARRLLGKDTYLKRFEQEARAAAAVSHPRLVRAFDVETEEDPAYLVMEYVDGANLRDLVLRDGPLPVRDAAEYIRQTAEGLEAAHKAGLVHRDIKPSNLLLQREGGVRILDLGLARIVDPETASLTLMQDNKVIGTVDYLSPEQARNSHHIDGRADIYSLGCTLYFLLTAQPPFNDGSLAQRVVKHLTTRPRDLRKRRAEIPDELAFICHKMLAKSPDRRYQTAGEVAAVLGDWLAGRPIEMTAPTPAPAANSEEAGADEAAGSDVSLAAESSRGSGTSGGRSLAAAARKAAVASDELELAPDDVEDRSTGSRAGQSSTRAPASQPGRPASPAPPAKQPRPAAAVRPAPASTAAGPLTALAEDSMLGGDSLSGSDTLAGFLSDLDALTTQAGAASGTDPLGAGSGELSDSAARAIPPAASAATQSHSHARRDAPEGSVPGINWRERLDSMVREKDDGGSASYALWFCIVAGVLLGLIISWAGWSAINSSQQREGPKKEGFERPRPGLPLPPMPMPRPRGRNS